MHTIKEMEYLSECSCEARCAFESRGYKCVLFVCMGASKPKKPTRLSLIPLFPYTHGHDGGGSALSLPLPVAPAPPFTTLMKLYTKTKNIVQLETGE